jgi:hypothetical protein
VALVFGQVEAEVHLVADVAGAEAKISSANISWKSATNDGR